MKTYTFRTIIEKDDPSGYHGFVPALKGLHTCGDSIEEVKKNLHEAILCHIQGLLKDGLAVPQEDQTMEIIQTVSTESLLRKPAYA